MSTSVANDRQRIRRRHWWAWMGMCGALAIHIVDETVTDFLTFQNASVLALRKDYPFLPIPMFSFEVWLSLLIFALIALTAVSYFVWKGRWAMRPISYVFAAFMIINGLLHIAVSIYLTNWISGVYSSPLLLVAGAVLIFYTHAYQRRSA
ncbi:MAG TPA: HXXEE domain-containing protein [Pyrinomonadaceae bacterium]